MNLKELAVIAAFGAACLLASQSHAASGQGVAEAARVEECKNILRDELHIGMALAKGQSADHIRIDAMSVRGELGEERYVRVLELIDAAHLAFMQGKLSEWFDQFWQTCVRK